MSQTRKFPTLKGDVSFEWESRTIVVMTVSIYGERAVKAVRNNKRWRHVGGPFIRNHAIAAAIFDYDENPTTEEMEFMGGYVDSIGVLIDSAVQAVEAVRDKLKERYGICQT